MGKDVKILVVDDDAPMRTIIRYILEHTGYHNVIEAHNGLSAFEVLKSQKIDFIISDWNMPGMTGLELLRKVREDSAVGQTPFLMLTVEKFAESMDTAAQNGVSGYMVKPFTAKVLIEKMEKIIGKVP